MSKYNYPKDLQLGDKVVAKNCGQHHSTSITTMFVEYSWDKDSIIDNKGNAYNMWTKEGC